MKKILAGILIGCLTLFMATGAMASNANHKAYFIVGQNSYSTDGQVKQMDATTFVESGRTYVPVRYLGNALGVDGEGIKWQDPNASLTLGDTTVKLTMGSKQYQLNGQSRIMDVTPVNRNGRIYLPARFVAEAFGYEVGWDNTKRAVLIGPKGNLPSVPVVDLTGQGEPIAGKPWGNVTGQEGTVTFVNDNEFKTKSFKINHITVHDIKFTKDSVIVTQELPLTASFGVRMVLLENDKIMRYRVSVRPKDDRTTVYDFKYNFNNNVYDNGFPKFDIKKIKSIVLINRDTALVVNNPLYTGVGK